MPNYVYSLKYLPFCGDLMLTKRLFRSMSICFCEEQTSKLTPLQTCGPASSSLTAAANCETLFAPLSLIIPSKLTAKTSWVHAYNDIELRRSLQLGCACASQYGLINPSMIYYPQPGTTTCAPSATTSDPVCRVTSTIQDGSAFCDCATWEQDNPVVADRESV